MKLCYNSFYTQHPNTNIRIGSRWLLQECRPARLGSA